ncbi:peptidoglycan-binding protein [Amycolatopsis pithecellobii]|uniref:Helix-turn-helix domain-containing protein n=1 Tax=Amycolatopsis pithecellobii TaxID=664692 RepID=A0A6N7Z7P9_9PSEU|nr:peptidoglycan-binding protein [Amycolatopsis pithecellobii]MTD57180.1 helix-turn-helix domain-containing protein [Amycolatopsis pithecellobii]
MARWKPLPAGLGPQVRELVVRLRELKDQMGISTATLARKTAYSKSSWDRYLNGMAPPPRQAVEALGLLAGADPSPLLALWELAGQGVRHTMADAKPASATTDAEAEQGRRRWIVVAASVAVAVAVGAGLAAWLSVGGGSSAPTSASAAAPALPAGYTCVYTTRDGRLYAGHSTTSDQLVALNGGSEDVVEVQCLLVHRSLDPGRIDGLFGQHTEQAVKQLQTAAGIPADGIVGPQTWALLRS